MKKFTILAPLFVAVILLCAPGISTAKAVKGIGVTVTDVSITDDGNLTLTLKNQLSVEVSKVQAVIPSMESAEDNAKHLKSQPSYSIAPSSSYPVPLANADEVKKLISRYTTSYKIIGCGTSPKPPSTGKAHSYTRAVPLPVSWAFSVPSGRRTETLQGIFIYLDLL